MSRCPECGTKECCGASMSEENADLRARLEQEHEKARKYQLIAGACLGGTDYADKILEQSKHCYEAHDLALKLHRERDDELIAASIKPYKERLEQAEARCKNLWEALEWYGDHLPACDMHRPGDRDKNVCDCGFREALSPTVNGDTTAPASPQDVPNLPAGG